MNLEQLRLFLLAADSGGNNGQSTETDTAQDDTQDEQEDAPANFDEWLTDQPDTIKNLIDNHVDGLRSALTNERSERKKLTAQLKQLGAKAEKGSDLEKEIATLTESLDTTQRRATFYEKAHTAGVKNLPLAYLAATDFGLFDNDGDVNFEKLKEQAPELFTPKEAPKAAKGNAGTGQSQQGAQPTMNNFLRAATGRK